MSSIYDDIEQVRKPRVHIKYQVETEGATVEKELPFIIGVMADFSGNAPNPTKKPLTERKFINIDKDNFNTVMRRLSPTLNLRVKNSLSANDSELSLQLQFNKMEDFEPANLVDQVACLAKLKQARNALRDLVSQADRSTELEKLLEKMIKNPEKLALLTDQLDYLKEQGDQHGA